MENDFFIEQYISSALQLISPQLYELDSSNNGMIYFHDEERADLFYIRLNEFINARFNSPLDNDKQVTVFQLLIDLCKEYNDIIEFNEFIKIAEEVKDFLFRVRYYRYYISPHEINFDLSISDMLFFKANYAKHSIFHLNILKSELKKIFKENQIENFEKENYNHHLITFNEAVLEDRLEFNSTHIIETLGRLFIAFRDLLHCSLRDKTLETINEYIQAHGRLAQRNLKEPDNLNKGEKFFWSIKAKHFCKEDRLLNHIPNTIEPLIEKLTSKNKRIVRV